MAKSKCSIVSIPVRVTYVLEGGTLVQTHVEYGDIEIKDIVRMLLGHFNIPTNCDDAEGVNSL